MAVPIIYLGKKYTRDEWRETRIIDETAQIGKDVTLFPNIHIGAQVKIGDGSIIQSGAFIEHDCNIGHHSRIGTNAVLRRETNIGDYSIFGSLSASEGKNWIGNHVLIHSQCHLTTGIIVEDWVFIAPLFVGANDPDMLHGRRHIKKFMPQAPHIKFGARLGINVTVNPNVTIGRECVIGSASLVTRDVPAFSVAYGAPAKVVRQIEDKWRLPQKHYDDFKNRVSSKELTQFVKKLII